MAASSQILQDTLDAVLEAKTIWGSLSAMCNAMALPDKDRATLSAILRGVHEDVSIAAENRIRVALGLHARPAMHLVQECPIHGVPHLVTDCGGVDGTPVMLPTDARIVKAGPKRRRKKMLRLAVDPAGLDAGDLAWWKGMTLAQRAEVIHGWRGEL
jgi:hypothetical protein